MRGLGRWGEGGGGGGGVGGWVPQIDVVAVLFGRPFGHHTPRMEWRNEVQHREPSPSYHA